ncbi:MAG: thiolase family protein [Synergistaceae bacterium]|nr:thiolase family protein [Synergistaceae bacterium]
MEKETVVIASAVRTPFDKFGGVMRSETTVKLGSHVVKEILRRAEVDPAEVDETYIGINMPTANRSIARQITLDAGMPPENNSTTVDRACCSSMVAIAMAKRAIELGEAKITIGGGSENMSNVPYFLEDLRWGKRMGHIMLKDIMIVSCPYTGEPRAKQAGEVGLQHGITREMQDEWAYRSQMLYQEAFRANKFKDEIIPYTVHTKKGDIVVDVDQAPRADTTLEGLAKLKTVNESPTVTAGNAPGLNTGASGLVLMSETEAKRRGVKPMATFISHAQASGHPKYIATIPAFAAQKALDKAGMTIDQMDMIEINEAFAVMPLASTLLMGGNDPAKVKAIRDKTNINGGAIAIGHPTGATGGRLVMTMAYELMRRGGGYGLCTICGGVGESEAFIIRV